MVRALVLLAFVFGGLSTLAAQVPRPAPDFAWEGLNGQATSIKSFRGQPVVVLMGDSGRSRRLRSQIARLEELYRFYSARRVVFVAAVRSDAKPLRSDIPFVLAQNGAAVASAFGIERGFGLAIIAPDGNVDLLTDEVTAAARIRDVLDNTFQRQQAIRKKN